MAPDLPLIQRLRRTNAERDLLRPGARVLVAVSGGPDSLALLHALHAMRAEWRLELVAAHLNHRMRGPAGEADAAFVRDTAGAWGIPVEIGARDVPALARRTGLSLEEAGRAARYRFFGRAARRTGCPVIATGHTADECVETVLLHLFRGTGLDGLAGIPARRPLSADRPSLEVLRPFIDVSRAEVLEYCAACGLQPRHDATNESSAFLRNRVRRELLPRLEAEYAPALRRHLRHLARLAEEETALLDAQARELLAAAAADRADTSSHGSPSLRLNRAVLCGAPRPLARRALRLAVQSLEPGPPPPLAVVERLLSLLRDERPGMMLPGSRMTARATAAELILAPAEPVPPFLTAPAVPLAVPGTTPLPWGAGVIIAALRETCPHPLFSPRQALIDRARLAGPLMVRPPRPGDRIQPLGMAGQRKLQDLLTDRKVTRAARRRLPVVCDAEKIVWVAGHCVSELVRVTAETRESVEITWQEDA